MIARPYIYMEFGLGRPHGHHHFTIAIDLGFGIPLGVNV
jgi:hypothetical protein